MLVLNVSHDWASRIRTIRNATTEDTNLIRFDNSFYRVCRGGSGTFALHVVPSVHGARAVQLVMRERDLYVTSINGQPFENYAATLDLWRPHAKSLDGALMSLPKAHGAELFELQSLVVLCVAESIRNDHIATGVEQLIRTTTTGLIGVPTRLPLAELLDEARAWGQTSEALFGALSPSARDIVLKPRADLTLPQRQFSERVDDSRIDPQLRAWARSIKVLKRPS